MNSVIFVLGTDHDFQRRSQKKFAEPMHNAFADYIRYNVGKYSVQSIAEEYNQQWANEDNITESTLKSIARELKLEHRYCDPDRHMRNKLGIQQELDIKLDEFCTGIVLSKDEARTKLDESDRKREQHWFEQIQDLAVWPTLFICGANHASHFIDLIGRNNMQAVLLASDWGAQA